MYLATATIALVFGTSLAQSQTDCFDRWRGRTVSISGTIQNEPREFGETHNNPREWMFFSDRRGAALDAGCAVGEIWVEGRRLAGCEQGHAFSASGKIGVSWLVDSGHPALYATTVACH